MQTKLWRITYDGKYITDAERYSLMMELWPHKVKHNHRPVYVAADSQEEAENKIRKEFDLPSDLNLDIKEHKSYAFNLVIV